MTADPRHVQAQLALTLSRNIQRMLTNRDEAQTRRSTQLVHDGVATGVVNLSGPGESTASVDFAMTFTEKPIFTYGFELGPSSWIEQGTFPVGSAIVTRWRTQQLNEMTVWTGASLAIVLTGTQGPGMCHYHFMGRAFATPAGTSSS